jgi:asparagine synthase (glutamine-hydrolysing)
LGVLSAQDDPGAWQTELEQSAPERLAEVRGAFALGWQTQSGETVLGIDRFGQRTMCWTNDGKRLRSAQRATDLATTDTPLDPQALFDYLYFHVIPSPRTIFKGVYRLPAGHFAVSRGEHVDVRPYWTPAFTPQGGKPDFLALKDEFRSLLEKATGSLLDGGVPACFLSGGTDSSTVAGMIRQATGQAPHAYSIGFDAEGYDEMAYAKLAADRFGAQHHAYYVTPDDLVKGIPAVAAHYDQPFGNSSALPAYYCARMAKNNGVTRLLAGDGGDELFGGNERYAKQQVFAHYAKLPSWVQAGLEPLLLNGLADSLPLLRKGGSYIRQAKVPLPDRLQTYNLLNRLGASQVFTNDFLQQVDAEGPLAQQRDVWARSRQAGMLNCNLAFDWRYTLAENDLPKVCGTAAMAGVDVRFPLLDEDLLAFSLKLPDDYKLRGKRLRWFFKEALRGFLPDEILTKQKHGFGLPFGVWTRQHDGLRQLATDSLRSLANRGFIRPDFVRSLLEDRTAEHAGYYGEMVWVMMLLEQWLQLHRPNYKLAA